MSIFIQQMEVQILWSLLAWLINIGVKSLIAVKQIVFTQGAVKVYQQVKQNKMKYNIILRNALEAAF